MNSTPSYFKVRKKDYTEKLRALLKQLPPFAEYYFRAKESSTTVLTRYGYACDIKIFFLFCLKELEPFVGTELIDISLDQLESLTARDIEQYMEYLSFYSDENLSIRENNERAKARKLSAIKSFFKYYHKQGMLSSNPTTLVDTPKIHEKAIIRLEANEVADLLDIVEDGSGLSEKQQKYHRITESRDSAILALFLGTGIRISELVGIDCNDIDFADNSFLITRKGGNQERLSFSDEVAQYLLEYDGLRKTIIPVSGQENAFFLSLQKKRINVRSVENLVKKYAKLASPLKKITPHKLRSTYGTMLYQESGDIYLVADVLGHKDVNTTRKHYAAQSEERRRTASKYIQLREDSEIDNSES